MKLQYLGYFNELEIDKKSLEEHIALALMFYLIDFPIWLGTLTWALLEFCRNFPIWLVILTWSLIYFRAKSPSSLLF